MRKWLLFLTIASISGLQIAQAASTDTLEGTIAAILQDSSRTSGTLVEQAVVELRITKAELPSSADARYKHKKQDLMGHGVCSGSFIDAEGDIVTAGHCAENAIEIEVITYDQHKYRAIILATTSVHDLALLHIDRRNTAHFNPATSVAQGEQIFILGSPLAITGTLSTGIVAKVDGDEILLDCSVLPGNSGSAVYNTKGEMVGVATAGYIVGMGTTHLNIAQSIDAVWYFISRAFRGIKQ